MNSDSKNAALLKTLLLVLLLFAAVKLLWSLVDLLLPATGINADHTRHYHLLPHRYRLASDAPLPPTRRTDKVREAIKGMKLLAIYRGPKQEIIVVRQGGRAYVLSRGEAVLGYRLKRIENESALFEKHGKEYRLTLPKLSGTPIIVSPSAGARGGPESYDTVHKEEDTIVVPRPLLTLYIKDSAKIWKNIGISPEKNGKKLRGFRVRFVKSGSLFETLGLRRGDLITAINGEPIENYDTVMELYRSVDTITDLSLQIRRGKEEVELDYEIQ